MRRDGAPSGLSEPKCNTCPRTGRSLDCGARRHPRVCISETMIRQRGPFYRQFAGVQAVAEYAPRGDGTVQNRDCTEQISPSVDPLPRASASAPAMSGASASSKGPGASPALLISRRSGDWEPTSPAGAGAQGMGREWPVPLGSSSLRAKGALQAAGGTRPARGALARAPGGKAAHREHGARGRRP